MPRVQLPESLPRISGLFAFRPDTAQSMSKLADVPLYHRNRLKTVRLKRPSKGDSMKKTILFAALAITASANFAGAEMKGTPTTVTGWVLDSACAYTKGLTKPISRQCAVDCARKGSPLVLLGEDGTIFLPISDAMPAEGQNERLMPFAGTRVTASGKLYAKAGSRALVIEKIEAAK